MSRAPINLRDLPLEEIQTRADTGDRDAQTELQRRIDGFAQWKRDVARENAAMRRKERRGQ